MVASTATREPWRKRLFLPTYLVQEAARYAQTTPKTIRSWQGRGDLIDRAIAARDAKLSLSYMQLIEVAVVAAFRRGGIKLADIKAARDWLATTFKSEYPFAQFDFKRRGKELLVDYEKVEKKKRSAKLLAPSKGGQFVWEEMVGDLLSDFEYVKNIALRWHVIGKNEPIIIDPRVSFGAPNVHGVPTWILKGRWEAGESITEIAEDFDLKPVFVTDALKFEGVDEAGQKRGWVH
jgi:uncharacterized protein (DUF433 family)